MSFLESKIYRLYGPRDLRLDVEFIDKDKIGEEELLVETVYTCISPGTELAAYQGLPPLRPGKQYPRLLGYCNVGRVVKKGSQVHRIKTGDLVLSFTSHRQYSVMTAREVILVLPEEIDVKKAAAVYLYHLGYMALLESAASPGSRVAVLGTGTLGYCTATLASECGFTVSVFSNQEYLKEEFESRFISFHKKEVSHLSELESVFDVVINTSNSWNDWRIALKLLRKKGVMVNLGFPGRGQQFPDFNPLDSQFFYDKFLTLKTAGYVYEGDADAWDIQHTLKRNIKFLLQKIVENKIDPAAIISKVSTWEQLSDTYNYLLQRNERKFTALLDWNIKDV